MSFPKFKEDNVLENIDLDRMRIKARLILNNLQIYTEVVQDLENN